MAAPLTPEKRLTLERDLKRRRDKPSVRDYARKHQISSATVVRYAKALGIDFGETKRSATENASKAMRSNAKLRLEGIRVRLLDEADGLLDSLHKPYMAWNFGGRDNDYNEHEFAEPDIGAKKTILTTVAIIIDKCVVIEKQSTGGGEHAASQFAAFLASIVDPVGEYDAAGVS